MAKFSVGSESITTLRTWANALRNLTFVDNFKGVEWVGEIEAGEEAKITHRLGVVPTRFIVTLFRGSNNIVKSERPATLDFIYIRNRGTTSTFQGKILILP